jgi:hypothetical protein
LKPSDSKVRGAQYSLFSPGAAEPFSRNLFSSKDSPLSFTSKEAFYVLHWNYFLSWSKIWPHL